jgi:hypothetical protein
LGSGKGYRGEIKNIEVNEKQVEHDIWYMENWSILLDIKIMYLTLCQYHQRRGKCILITINYLGVNFLQTIFASSPMIKSDNLKTS